MRCYNGTSHMARKELRPLLGPQIAQSPYARLSNFVHQHEGTVTGYKFQCVEIARRYLVANRGVVFDSIPMAFNICERGVAPGDTCPCPTPAIFAQST